METSIESETQAQQAWKLRESYRGPSLHDSLLKNEFATVEHQQDALNRNLRRMLEHCYDAVPYYRDRFQQAGVSRRQLRDPASLQRLPILEKEDVEKQFEGLRAQSLMSNQRALGSTRSSGTTGQPTLVLQTDASIGMFRWLKQRELRWYRYNPLAAMLSIRPSIELPRLPDGNLLQNENYLKVKSWPYLGGLFETGEAWAFNNTNSIKDQVKLLEKIKSQYLLMQSAGLEYLSMQSISEDAISILEGVHAISQTLTPIMRSQIEASLQVPVHQNYGLNEIGMVASRCTEGGRYHVHSEHCLVEIIDSAGNPCRAGEYGKLLVTSLTNSAMPLLRYDADDMAEALEGPCPCGRTLASFGAIQGRYRRIAQLPEGSFERWAAIQLTLYKLAAENKSAVSKYQAYQNQEGDFQLRIDCDEEIFSKITQQVEQDFKLAVDEPDCPDLEVVRTNEFHGEQGRKFQNFISEFIPDMDR
ncbi:MAG: hypothetical protein GKR91_07050 [Pseudomonadales bacterium]|nr:hypothetical protein [Pseudomonadales bacterium]